MTVSCLIQCQQASWMPLPWSIGLDASFFNEDGSCYYQTACYFIYNLRHMYVWFWYDLKSLIWAFCMVIRIELNQEHVTWYSAFGKVFRFQNTVFENRYHHQFPFGCQETSQDNWCSKETCSYQNYSTSLPSFCLDFPQTLPWEYGDVNCWISLDKPWNNANHRKPDRRQSTIALWHGYNLRTSRIRMISERHPICAEVHIMRLEIVNITDNDTNCRWSVWKRLGRTRRS